MDLFKSLFQRSKNPLPITIVSGLPRSGTSLMMQMLQAAGIPPLTDKQRAADADNPNGYFEYERVKKLHQGDTDWLPQAQGKALKVIATLLPYLPPGYPYRVIFVRRAMQEVLASQSEMLARRGESSGAASEEEMVRIYTRHLAEVELWLVRQPEVEKLDVDYNLLLANPEPTVRRVAAFIDRPESVQAMRTVIDPALYRNRQS